MGDFPDDFLFGVATAAYQIEGGADCRGETVFDHFVAQNPSTTIDGSNAKISCDSYHKYQEDLDNLSYLGVNFYRFSIAWSRILPTGYDNLLNKKGIQFYHDLLDGLLQRNIKPVVTMYHYDLPKPLQDLGGWTNPLVVDYFVDYAQILFENFGDRVPIWLTFNVEAWGYGDDLFPPKINQSGIAEYLAYRHIILAHARTYHLYQEKFKMRQNGEIGLTLDSTWYEASNDCTEEFAERVRQFHLGIILNPIYGSGNFPEIVQQRIDHLSETQGFTKSRLPKFSETEALLVRGSFDFLGLNVYTSYLVKPSLEDPGVSFKNDHGATIFQDDQWESSASAWLKVVPSTMQKVLKWTSEQYNFPKILITENGFSDKGILEDFDRVSFHYRYLQSLLDAISKDNVQVFGYAAWSFMDNFEWLQGYTEKFGLFQVDFSDPNRTRTAKYSAKWYKKLIAERILKEPINLAVAQIES